MASVSTFERELAKTLEAKRRHVEGLRADLIGAEQELTTLEDIWDRAKETNAKRPPRKVKAKAPAATAPASTEQ